MNKILLTLFFVGAIFFGVKAQERHIYTQHFINPILINPVATGFDDSYGIIINYGNKWAGFDGGPKSFTLSYDGPVANRLSVGALILRDGIASLETLKGQLSYAYKIPADNYQVSFGLTTEYIQYGLSGSDLNDPLLDLGDGLLLERLEGSRFFDVTAGVYGVYNENITFGLALPGLVRARLDNNGGTSERTINYIVHLGYKYDVPNYDFYIEPSLFIKQLRYTPFHADVNVKLGFMEDQLIGGLTYSLGYERLGFLIGTKVNNFNVYYSYNVSLEESQQYHNGLHEFTLGFNISGLTIQKSEDN
jgi:type IX secretion system PorP/SprF family membrane protein